jgi:hypothetical protein
MSLFFIFFISQICNEARTFTYSYFAWGLHGDVDVRWSGVLLDFELH